MDTQTFPTNIDTYGSCYFCGGPGYYKVTFANLPDRKGKRRYTRICCPRCAAGQLAVLLPDVRNNPRITITSNAARA